MAGSDELRLQMMGLGAPVGMGTAPAPAAAEKKDGKADAGYPTLEGLLKEKARFEAFIGNAEKSMAKLEELADKGGSAQVKADARKALRAYDHAMELLKKGVELTAQAFKAQQARMKAAGAKK